MGKNIELVSKRHGLLYKRNMINTYTVITSDYKLLLDNNEKLQGVQIGFELKNLSFFDELSLEYLHQYDFVNGGFFFSICINTINSDITLEQINQYIIANKHLFVQYTFHCCYKITAQKPVVFIYTNDETNHKLHIIKETLNNILKEQGYMGVEIVYFSKQMRKGVDLTLNNCFDDTVQGNDVFHNYEDHLKNKFLNNRYIGIKTDGFIEVIEKLRAAEHTLLTEVPLQYKILQEHKNKENQIIKLQEELRLTKIDLENQKTYLKVIKDADEAGKIDRFYFNEYEILPLWYKKFGHLLKVLMGKRSFRSLFDNNVKKYKD